MESRPVELILAHSLSEHQSAPVLLMDAAGALIFFNEPAERILGLRYEDVGELGPDEWTAHLHPVSGVHKRLDPRELKVMRAVAEGRPAYDRVRLQLADDSVRHFDSVALPLTDRDGRYLGAIVVFWRPEEEE